MDIQLKRLRKERTGMKQKDFAERLGMKPSTYNSWENGKAEPRLSEVYECARLIGCTIDEIAGVDRVGAPDMRQLHVNDCYRAADEAGRALIDEYAGYIASNPKYRRGNAAAEGAGDAPQPSP